MSPNTTPNAPSSSAAFTGCAATAGVDVAGNNSLGHQVAPARQDCRLPDGSRGAFKL
jgi:hypothetical protein